MKISQQTIAKAYTSAALVETRVCSTSGAVLNPSSFFFLFDSPSDGNRLARRDGDPVAATRLAEVGDLDDLGVLDDETVASSQVAVHRLLFVEVVETFRDV